MSPLYFCVLLNCFLNLLLKVTGLLKFLLALKKKLLLKVARLLKFPKAWSHLLLTCLSDNTAQQLMSSHGVHKVKWAEYKLEEQYGTSSYLKSMLVSIYFFWPHVTSFFFCTLQHHAFSLQPKLSLQCFTNMQCSYGYVKKQLGSVGIIHHMACVALFQSKWMR